MASNTELQEWITQAKQGNTTRIDQYFKQLYRKLEGKLLQQFKSKDATQYYLCLAMARFWEKFVHEDKPLPQTNWEAYFASIAKNAYLDDLRKKHLKTVELDSNNPSNDVQEDGLSEQEYLENDRLELLKAQAMRQALQELTDICKDLLTTILETGKEKPSELQAILNWADVRQVTVRKHDCTKQLKKRATEIFEELLKKKIGDFSF